MKADLNLGLKALPLNQIHPHEYLIARQSFLETMRREKPNRLGLL
jgi:hypothetical protein